jgi:hypothetical protein
MTKWEPVTTGLSHGGYVAWETAVDAVQGSGPRDHVPVFLELAETTAQGMSQAEAIAATLSLTGVLFSQHERNLLTTEGKSSPASGWTGPVRAVALCPRVMLQDGLPAFWKVLQVGPAVAVPPIPYKGKDVDLRTTKGNLDPNVPVMAVIDDGIGFLNARFRKSKHETRLKAVWLQAPERVEDGGPASLRDVVVGKVLTEAEINKHLETGGEEAEIYRQVNRALLPQTDGALTNHRVAHGTHVLDLAAGATPWAGDPMLAVPMLAVQLPPSSVRETSGRRMEAYLVQGLRWILAEAFRLSNETDVPPIVINLSVGSLAGPGDKTAFLANWFEYEIERHIRMTGGEVRLVIAYGNAWRQRLAARGELRGSLPLELQWRVLPDDHTSSFLELRVAYGMTDGLELTFTPPAGSGLPELVTDWPADGKGWSLPGPLAAVTSTTEAEAGQALLHLALAPTATMAPMSPSPPGAWRVKLRTTMSEPVLVTARVQRDDTPPGYRTLGRQSWLDHPEGWGWDDETRSYNAPRPASDGPGCPVTREGTCVAFAGAESSDILFVGATRPAAEGVRPALYSSSGVRHLAREGESAGPTLAASGDEGVAVRGRLASGVLSGSTVRMSGTSMAAPSVSRALAQYFLTVPKEHRNKALEQKFLTGEEWSDRDLRLGHGVLISRTTRGGVIAAPFWPNQAT